MIKNYELYINEISKTIKINKLNSLKNSSILITGANGMIASCIVDVLNYLNETENYNAKIYIMVREKNKILSRFINYANVIVVERDVTQKILLNEHIDYIIHAASNSHPKAFVEDPVGTMLANFIGTNNILEFAINNKCKRVLYVSSGEVYGQGDKDLEFFNEDYLGKLNLISFRSCYPVGKLAAETLCMSYTKQYGIETVIARPCHCYGPTQTENDSRVSAQFINNVLNNKDIIMKSNGSQIRSYCYVVDCAIGILTILAKGENMQIYNVANNNSILSIREMAEIIAKKNNKKVIIDLPSDYEKSGFNTVTKSVLNGKKLENLGWKPIFDFEHGIEETLKIMSEDKNKIC